MTRRKTLNKKIFGIIICLFIIPTISINSAELETKQIHQILVNESISIDANSNQGNLHLNNGFLHGRDENSPDINETLLAALKPEEWRLYKINSYIIAQRHNANITYGLSNYYAWSQGGFPEAKPWENWTHYENYILNNMQVFDNLFPNHPVDYYDIWSEPDHTYYWKGTYTQLLELFSRAYHVIKTYNPNAKVVGPSISWFRPGYPGVTGIIDFLIDLDTIYGVRLDAISWHENGGYTADTKPEDIPNRAQYLRSQIQAHFPPDYQPDFHINEYLGGILHLSPGWNVGFLRYLEEAHINKSMRACWYTYSLDPDIYCSDCWYGLNGMFMSDGQTPQRAYWIQYTHTQMEGHTKLTVIESNENTNAIAIRNESSHQIQLLIGRYYTISPTDVAIHITNYHYHPEHAYIKTELVPNDPTFYTNPPQMIPMPGGPILLSNDSVPIINNEINLLLENYEDGDAYIITITPFNNPPHPPNIEGPLRGKTGITYTYTITPTDPDQNDLTEIIIDWDDTTGEETITGPFTSGEQILANHTWTEKDTYTIKAKTKDIHNSESDWATLEVTIPKNKPLKFNLTLLNWLFETFPKPFPILRYLLNL